MMDEYKIIKSGKSILPFINIPPEFENINLEITIKPARKQKNKKELKAILNRYQHVKPFSSIKNPVEWQKGIRDEW